MTNTFPTPSITPASSDLATPASPPLIPTHPEDTTMTATDAAPLPLLDPPTGSPVAVDVATHETPAPVTPPQGPAGFDTARRRWEIPALIALLLVTAGLYLWDLGSSGWANSYYSAAVQAGTQSWKAFFFGSFDAANAITVDKPPASLWVMEISARIFGVNSWSILVPQALRGVASVGVLFVAVRRWFGPVAGLIAGATLALTPVAVLMFRFNNPDALLVLLLVLAAWAVTVATEKASWRWLAFAGALVGFAFLTKMMQAYLVLPAFVLAYLLAADTTLWRRIKHLLIALVAVIVASSWWIAIVQLWPADSRPYIGGSQTNSIVELLFGYNGLGRITGNETGSVVPGGNAGAGMWGETGLTRLFSSSYGGQASWLIPTALLLLGLMLVMTVRRPRTDRLRAAAILWGGWLLVTGLVISLSQGIIHEYYTVALAPAIGALVGIGTVRLWRERAHWWSRASMAVVMALTTWWAWELLGRSSDFLPWLRTAVLAVGLGVTVGLLVVGWLGKRGALVIAGAALVVGLAGPAAYAVNTATTPHSGSLPTAGPSVAGGRGFGPGGLRGGPGGQGGPSFGGNGTLPGGTLPGGTLPGGTLPGGTTGGPGGGNAAGGLLNSSTPGAAITALLSTNADQYTWVAATVGANRGAGYQLATGDPVMAIGGFNGSDPSPTLAQFQELAQSGKIHYFIADGGNGGGPGGPGGSSTGSGSQISTWVSQNYTAQTVDGVTVYDLTAPTSTTSTTTGTSGTTA